MNTDETVLDAFQTGIHQEYSVHLCLSVVNNESRNALLADSAFFAAQSRKKIEPNGWHRPFGSKL
jgi:hypothetical protein